MARRLDVGSRAAVPAAKIQVPRVPRRVVPRDRLVESLQSVVEDDDPHAPTLALVRAPAGYGKTVLLADWAQQAARDGVPVAWVSLDRDDNDPYVLWSAILWALEESGAWGAPGEEGPAELRQLSPPKEASERGFLVAVIEVLGRAAPGLTLVLDDIHELTDQAVLDGLDLLVRSKPPGLRLVLAGRAEPRLSLHRLRMDAELVELVTSDLAFTPEEAQAMLLDFHVDLDESDLEGLMERTEGWAAGLRIVARLLAADPAGAEVINAFRGDDRALGDYLVAEVIDRQPVDVRDFLFATCAPERLSVDLARHLSGRADAGGVLDDLERANALIVRLGDAGGLSYRYHALLRGYLQAEAARREGQALRRQHAETARWLSRHGAPAAALDHAASAHDGELLAHLVEEHGLRLVLGGQGPALRRLVGGTAVADEPGVAVMLGLASLDAGDGVGADAAMAGLREADFAAGDDRGRILYATARLSRALIGGDVPEALALLASTPAGATGDRDLDLVALAHRGPARLRLGDYGGAADDNERALALAREAGHDWLVLTVMSRLAGSSGALTDFGQMRRWSTEAIEFATSRGWSRSPRVAYGYVVAAWMSFQTGENDAMHHWAARALEVVGGVPDLGIEVSVHSMAAVSAFESGEDRRGAFEQLREVWHTTEVKEVSPALIAFAAPQELRMAVDLGEYAQAGEVIDRVTAVLGDCAESRFLRATLHERMRRRGAARQVLAPVFRGEVAVHVPSTLAAAWVLEAAMADADGEAVRAHQALEQALSWTAPNEAVRLFVDAPSSIRLLLAANAGRFGRWDAFVERLLRLLPAADDSGNGARAGAAAAESLTARELELLRDLPSLMSLEQIAAARSISVNTAKSHLRALYRKLGASSRRDAVARARQRGLL